MDCDKKMKINYQENIVFVEIIFSCVKLLTILFCQYLFTVYYCQNY